MTTTPNQSPELPDLDRLEVFHVSLHGGDLVRLADVKALLARRAQPEGEAPQAEPVAGAPHLTPENVAATIKDLREIEAGTTAFPVEHRDWRTQAGVLARIIEWLAGPAAQQAESGAQMEEAFEHWARQRGYLTSEQTLKWAKCWRMTRPLDAWAGYKAALAAQSQGAQPPSPIPHWHSTLPKDRAYVEPRSLREQAMCAEIAALRAQQAESAARVWDWDRRAEAARAFLSNYADRNMEVLLDGYQVQQIIRRLAAAIQEWQLAAQSQGAQAAGRDQVLEEAALACEAWGKGKVEKWAGDPDMAEDAKARAWDGLQCAAAIRALKGRAALAAKAEAPAPSKPTDLSHRLRETADQQPGWKSLLTAAANEIERYYGGMMAWKQTAEKKDRDWQAERTARVDDRCAARAQQAEASAPSSAEIANVILRLVGECAMDWKAGATGDPDDAFTSDDEELRVLVDLVNKTRAQQAAAPGTMDDLLPTLGIRNDRDMLNYLMTAFDNEIANCERCGHAEPTKNMDSASFLRDYLAAAPSAPGTPEAPAGRPLAKVPGSELQLELHLRRGPNYQCQHQSCRSMEDGPAEFDTCPACGLKGFLSGSFVKNRNSAEWKAWEQRTFDRHRAAQLDGGQGEGDEA